MDNSTVRMIMPFLSAAADLTDLYPLTAPYSAPRVSPNRKLTRGAHQMSQRERANRRKAKRRS